MKTPTYRAQLEPVATPEVGGVVIRRHVLECEAARAMHLARRLGMRLRAQLIALGPRSLPDEEWRETAEIYERILRSLLVEQRERAKLKPNAKPPISDEDAMAELAVLARQAVMTMPLADLQALMLARTAIDAPSIEVANDETTRGDL